MHLVGKYRISWSNDALESFLQILALFAPPPMNLFTSQWTMADRVNAHFSKVLLLIDKLSSALASYQ